APSWLQLAKPGLQAPAPHTPSTQTAAALGGTGQALPQPLQWLTSLLRLVSQPLAALPSQSSNPRLQALTWHWPSRHSSWPLTPVHWTPQPPQLLASLAVASSQPLATLWSQSAYPMVQLAITQVPDWQAATPLAVGGQARPQPPQFFTSF